jgi:hypothetical protein
MAYMGGTGSAVDDLILDLLEWLEVRPRPYVEVMEAWRTSCPRLPVWEEANARGFIVFHYSHRGGRLVGTSALGTKHVARFRSRATESC